MALQLTKEAAYLIGRLGKKGYEAYAVGGCVRDGLLGHTPNDWDICTSATPEETKACFPELPVIETGIVHGTVTVLLDGEPCEITTYRTDGVYSDGRRPDSVQFVRSLREDLARRDFTINAMAYHPVEGLRDPFNGQADLKNRIIRCVGDPHARFQEDALRILRALRFSAVLGFHIEENTARALRENRVFLRHIAAERIASELCRLLCGQNAGGVLREFPEVFGLVLPELSPAFGFAQPHPRHNRDVWEHTAAAVEAAPPVKTIRLAMLLHDAGKPACFSADGNGVGHFYGHPRISADLAAEAMRRLKLDNATKQRVSALVLYHDFPLGPDSRQLRRLMNRLGEETVKELFDVRRADLMAQAPIPETMADLERLDAGLKTLREIIRQGQCFRLRDLAVNGHDLLAAGFKPQKAMGRVLKELLERVISGELPNQKEILLAEAMRKEL